MDKVKLPKEVAEAIVNVRKHYKAGAEYDLELMRNETFGGTVIITNFAQRSRENMILYFSALVNGFEVDQTPEDKVADYITRLRNMRDHAYTSEEDSKRINVEIGGALQVLEHLNIKIEGVNA